MAGPLHNSTAGPRSWGADVAPQLRLPDLQPDVWRLPGHPADGLCAYCAHVCWSGWQLGLHGPSLRLSNTSPRVAKSKAQDQMDSQMAK